MIAPNTTSVDRLAPTADRRPAAHSRIGRVLRLARKHPIGTIGAIIVGLVLIISILAPLIAPYEASRMLGRRLQMPSARFWLGTDELGRDVFSRIIYGARVSMYVGLIAVGVGLFAGGLIGVVAGFFGGVVDNLLMRFMDIILAFPGLVLAIVIAGLLGPSTTNAMIAIGIVYIPTFARIARSSVLGVRAEPYIDAAILTGGANWHIIRRHILPNIMVPIIIQASLAMSTAILSEAALSFLGLGTQPPTPSWGQMLSSSRKFMETLPLLAIVPGVAIMFVVIGFNFLGDGLRDALDPRLKE